MSQQPTEDRSSTQVVALERTDAELLAQICAGRAAGMPLAVPTWSCGLSGLTTLTEAQAMAMLGIPRLAAQRLLLAFALHRRLLAAEVPERPICRSPAEVAKVMRPLAVLDHERLWCLPLDSRHRLIGEPIEVARGDVDATDASPRAICRAALRAGAVAMIVVHNHPTGDPTPSAADVGVTRRIYEAGRTVDVRLLDHVIVTPNGAWTSLALARPEALR